MRRMALLLGFAAVSTSVAAGAPSSSRDVVDAQAPQSKAPTFEVASVKRNVSGADGSARNVGAGGRMVFENVSLRQLIAAAYDIQAFQLIGGPAWADSDRFDVMARAATNAPLTQLNLMLRTLLADRFKLVVRVEQRELPRYTLLRARDDGRLGPALKPASVDCGRTGRGRGTPIAGAPTGLPPGCRAFISPAGIDFAGQSIGELARVLSMATRRPVTDKTGLTGGYDLQLSFAPETGGATVGDAAPIDPNAPSLFTALQEQLGLKLEPERGPVDVVVIESAEQPTEN
jgi:uncharacterized protein (TIGR03435 family)